MNEFVKKELENLLVTCLEANKSEDYNVFLDYSGHVDAVQVRILTKDKCLDTRYSETIYVSGYLYEEDNFAKQIKVCIDVLNRIISISEVLR